MGVCSEKLCVRREFRSLTLWRDVFAEFVGTFMLMSVQSALPLSWGGPTAAKAVQTGLGVGFIVATMAWTLGDFGGGHLNPAVSFAMLLSCKISVLRAIVYMVAQVGGAIAGCGFVKLITPGPMQEGLAATLLGPDVAPWQGFLTEMWITTILVITVHGSTNGTRKKGGVFVPPLLIGLAVTLGIMSGWNHTGGSMNPARSIGPAVIQGLWTDHWVYWAGPMAGGALASVIYCVCLDRVGQVEEEEEAEPVGNPDIKPTGAEVYIMRSDDL